jgi:hypothetical protein
MISASGHDPPPHVKKSVDDATGDTMIGTAMRKTSELTTSLENGGC